MKLEQENTRFCPVFLRVCVYICVFGKLYMTLRNPALSSKSFYATCIDPVPRGECSLHWSSGDRKNKVIYPIGPQPYPVVIYAVAALS